VCHQDPVRDERGTHYASATGFIRKSIATAVALGGFNEAECQFEKVPSDYGQGDNGGTMSGKRNKSSNVARVLASGGHFYYVW